jgi:hypothetical protein
MPCKTRSVENISVSLTIKNGPEHSFADTCAKVTKELTQFLGQRMKKCLINKRSISATSVILVLVVDLKVPQEPYNLKTSIGRQLESCRVGIPQENLKKYVTVHAERCTSTRLAAGLCEYLPDSSAWRDLHSLIANEASLVSLNPYSPLADATQSGTSQSIEEPMCVDGASPPKGIEN